MSTFGEFLREKRLALGMGLREFCLSNGLDASNYSKLERDTVAPPSRDLLEKYAKFLKIEKDSKDWFNLFDLAAIAKKRIPDYVFDNKEFVAALPVFFRKASGEHYTKEELLKLAEDIKNSR